MAGQSIERRDALRMLAIASAARASPGFCRWAFALAPQSQARPARYEPRFFTVAEYVAVEQLADLIIPSDETPGARDAGVSEFIDFTKAAATVEAQGYMRWPRALEIIRFAEAAGFSHLGIAFCIGLAEEARTYGEMLEKRFRVSSICCKNCGLPKITIS